MTSNMLIQIDNWESPTKLFYVDFTPPEPVKACCDHDDPEYANPGGGGDVKILHAIYDNGDKIPESVIDKLYDDIFEKACEQYDDHTEDFLGMDN